MLSNIRVIEIGQVLSAPYAGMIFADLGAEVIKVEKPPAGDDARNMGQAFRDNASMTFHDVNRGKRSVMLDLKSAAGVDALHRLLGEADVLVHNLRPGEPAKLKVDAATLMPQFPRLIYCEMGAFGHKGPRKLQPGYEPLLQAYSGLVATNGERDRPPSRIGASIVDQGTGMWAVIGVLSALNSRVQTGKGTLVNVSLLETALGWMAPRINEFINQDRPAERNGTAHPNLVPYQAFDTLDGQIMICAGNDRLFSKLAHALERPEWVSDPRFATNRQRLQHRSAVVGMISEVLDTGPRKVWMERISAAGVPVAPVNSVPDMLKEEQVTAIDMVRPVGDAGFVLTGLPVSFDGTRPAVEKPAPLLGADTEALLPEKK